MALRKRTISPGQIQEEYLLIEEAKKNPKRFALLYEKYYQQIFLFVFKRLNNEETAADVTSQVFLKAMTHLKKYKFQGVPFSAWLYRIAINEVNQHFRVQKGVRVISMESTDIAGMMEEVTEESSEESIRQMLSAMKLLSPDEVQLIELRYFEKMPFKEIAQVYNITENNAKVRMYRLLSKLKKLMERHKVPQK